MSARGFLISNAAEFIGKELALSDWEVVDQARVDRFGEATKHEHWMHCDPARATADGPYGGTIAHGFLILSFTSHFVDVCGLRPADSRFALNYGVDKVRFLAPMVVGEGFRLRDRITLLEAEPRPKGLFTRVSHQFEIDGLEKQPAVYAEALTLWIPKETAQAAE